MKEIRQSQTISYQNDPAAYARKVLGIEIWERQVEMLEAVRDYQRVLVISGHGIGKSFVAGVMNNWHFDAFPNSVTASTAPKENHLKNVLWRMTRMQRKHPPEPDILALKDPENPAHIAFGFVAKKDVSAPFGAVSAMGLHAERMLVMMDEAPGIDQQIWDAVDSLLVGTGNKAVAFGNPFSMEGPFYGAMRSGKWHVIQISCLEHPNIAAGLAGLPD